MPTVNIDGKDFRAEAGETVLEVARRNGIWIPTLCYHPALSEHASCRLCLVELDRGGWSQMVTSCCYPVRRDIRVRVHSEAAVRARRGVMELLLARCPDSPELRELARRMGIEGTPYPKVTEAQRNCILCGLCVRVCAERIGKAAIGFAGRGVNRAVAAPFRMPSEDCIGCGACAAICPVGTIKLRIHEKEIEVSPFKSRMMLRRCSKCGAPMSGEPHMKLLEEKAPAAKEYGNLCPGCRRKKSAAALVPVGAKPVTPG
ncbi:MAG: 2Fe-2S iron-sulfur cluster-binding protein [Planctomycetota bacterium]|nr:2Fe-2S iron-sulfur cluster-binding protein [Planctomycetota bacterium]